MNAHPAVSHPVSAVRGSVVAPGDKSCSHRAIILGALAAGTTRVDGLLESHDVAATLQAMTDIGAHCKRTGPGQWEVSGASKHRSPSLPLQMGNAGTSARLVMGAVASLGLSARFVGDRSLSRRPMERVLAPLRRMGVLCTSSEGTLPVEIESSVPLTAITHTQEHASAQIKSAILLAGLGADGTTTVIEPTRTRDHTEAMLADFGVRVDCATSASTYRACVAGGQVLSPAEITIAGDPSSAAFLWSTALILPGSDLVVRNVMDHPQRSGLTEAARAMGADLVADNHSDLSGIDTISLAARSGALSATCPGSVSDMIDEFPLFAVLAAYARGTSVVRGASELRHKESDRIGAVVAMLRANGVVAEEFEDGFAVEGCDGSPPGGGVVKACGDHRIAMSALVFGCGARRAVRVDDVSSISTSYPGFFADMARIGADIRS